MHVPVFFPPFFSFHKIKQKKINKSQIFHLFAFWTKKDQIYFQTQLHRLSVSFASNRWICFSSFFFSLFGSLFWVMLRQDRANDRGQPLTLIALVTFYTSSHLHCTAVARLLVRRTSCRIVCLFILLPPKKNCESLQTISRFFLLPLPHSIENFGISLNK